MNNVGKRIGIGVGLSLVGAVLFACSGSQDVDTPDPTEGVAGTVSSELKSGHCTLNGGGGSGSSSTGGPPTCQSQQVYDCPGGSTSILCTCNGTAQGSCTCGSLTFAFDCSNQCSIGKAQLKACGIH
jgi:hypothetical protein